MFNLLVSFSKDSWDSNSYEYERSRIAIEYTADEISERYKFLDENAINELKTFPTLFVTENEVTDSRVGYIKNIRIRTNTVVLDFEFDQFLPALPAGTLATLKASFDIGSFELSRTHWAIKDEDLFDILLQHNYITQAHIDNSTTHRMIPQIGQPAPLAEPPTGQLNTKQVFIVHGHDEISKLNMAQFITSLGLEPVILHRQASSGMTIIEKIEAFSGVGFAVVLYTPCDIASVNGEYSFQKRARQNVVFEHGYLIGKLGRERVVAVVKDKVEIPNDISGIVYVELDDHNNWQRALINEMKELGYTFPNYPSHPNDQL